MIIIENKKVTLSYNVYEIASSISDGLYIVEISKHQVKKLSDVFI